jgi:hypothetical protein
LYFVPSLQAIGIIIFKSSTDPLSNVSSVSYLKLVSINQVPTKSYWNSMIKQETVESARAK